MILIALSLLCSIPLTQATVGWGGCPDVDITQLDIPKYQGIWYEMIRDKTFPFESGTCGQAAYTILEDKSYFNVVNSQLLEDKWDDQVGKGYPQKNGSVDVKFFWYAPAGNLQIVKTDYDTVSFSHSCRDFLAFHITWNWLLKRDRSDGVTDAEIEFYTKLGTPRDNVVIVQQEGCPPYESAE